MSGRLVSSNRRATRARKFVLVLGLLAAAGYFAVAQPPGSLEIDDRPPLPPGEPKRAALAEKLRVPNPNAAIFKGRKDDQGNLIPNTGIVDFKPVASERENSDEYQAWTAVVQWARQFKTAELEERAARDLTRDDLLASPRFLYRLDLLRFEGKLTRVRRVPATKALQALGVLEVYEALLVPLDEPPTDVVSVVFTELPESLADLRQKPAEEWMTVESPAVIAGYFFKVKQDAKDEPIPILIGKSVTVLKGPAVPPTPGKNPAALDKNLRVFQFIKDDAFMGKGDDGWAEGSAWNRVLLHARQFMVDDLESNARTDLSFADLFLDGRRDYKLDLVRLEGRLIMLRRLEPTTKLRNAGLEAFYEGWLVPKDEPRGNPVCIVFTDTPEGVEPTGRVNKWVSFTGYSFKLLRYESNEQDKNNPKRNVIKRAPLLLGRAITILPDPEATTPVSWSEFFRTATIVVFVLLGTALGLTWWFRRGDRRAKQEINAHRAKNPFGEQVN